MSSLKISSISLDKEHWESVPRLLYNAFHVFSLNMTNIKQWAEKVEYQSKVAKEEHQALEVRVSAMDVTIESIQNSIKQLNDQVAAMSQEHQSHVDLFSSCLQQLIFAVGTMTAQICRSFKISSEDADKFASLRVAPQPQPSPRRRSKERVNPEASSGDLPMGSSKSERSSSVTSTKGRDTSTSASHQALKVLQEMSSHLEPRLAHVSEAFSQWGEWRNEIENRREETHSIIVELQEVQRKLRERLLTWCTVQKESAREVDSLHAALKRARAEILELRDSQVKFPQIEEAITSQARELQEKHDRLQTQVGGIADCLEAHMEEVTVHMKEVDTSVSDRIEKHATYTVQLLKTSLDPMSAYLNKLHVSTDVMRMDLDVLQAQTPQLVDSISDFDVRLSTCDERHSNKTSELDKKLSTIQHELSFLSGRDQAQHAAISESLRDLTGNIDAESGRLRAADELMSTRLQELKSIDMARFASDMSALEQKVVKWVQAEPLPAKMSEARLYALEAKLAEEMEARLMVEERVQDMLNDVLARSDSHDKSSSPEDTDGALALLPLLPRKPAQGKNPNVSPKLTKHMRGKAKSPSNTSVLEICF